MTKKIYTNFQSNSFIFYGVQHHFKCCSKESDLCRMQNIFSAFLSFVITHWTILNLPSEAMPNVLRGMEIIPAYVWRRGVHTRAHAVPHHVMTFSVFSDAADPCCGAPGPYGILPCWLAGYQATWSHTQWVIKHMCTRLSSHTVWRKCRRSICVKTYLRMHMLWCGHKHLCLFVGVCVCLHLRRRNCEWGRWSHG